MSEKHRIRTEKYIVTLLPEEKEILARNAQKFGLSRAEYIRRLILFGGIMGQPALDKEDINKLVYELSQINVNIKRISYETPSELLLQHPEWTALEKQYEKLLEVVGKLVYTQKEEKGKWQQQVSTILPRQ